MASTHTLPEGFLSGPAPNLKRFNVNFTKAGMPIYKDKWAVVLDGVLSEEECDELVVAAEATTNGTWERAMVNIGGGHQALYEDTRKCGRIIWDNEDLMAKLWARIEASVPEIHRLEKWADVMGIGPVKRDEVYKVTRLNERARFLKYVGGEYFKGMHKILYEKMLTNGRSALRRHLRDAGSQGTLVLYTPPVSQRPRGQGRQRTTGGRRNHVPRHGHGQSRRCSA
jgi:hypothetical protein